MAVAAAACFHIMSKALSVMTYNICDGGQKRLPLIQNVIASAAPDLVLLNEADDEPGIRQIARDLDVSYVWARGSGSKHIAFLSRLPIVEWHVYNRRPITQALLEVVLEQRAGVRLRIYGVHLLPYFMFLPYELARWRSISAILRVVRMHVQEPHLILGDFNALAPGDSADLTIFRPRIHQLMRLQANQVARLALRSLARSGYTDAFRALHPDERGWTWMPKPASARLDYIFADAYMRQRLCACEMVTHPPAEAASDHFPLLAQFRDSTDES